jgi:hypothetical protein
MKTSELFPVQLPETAGDETTYSTYNYVKERSDAQINNGDERTYPTRLYSHLLKEFVAEPDNLLIMLQ